MKASRRRNDKTLKRGYSAHLAPNKAIDKGTHGHGNNSFNREKDTYYTLIGDHHYCMRAARYGASTCLAPKGHRRTRKRDNVKCVTTFTVDRRRGEKISENVKVKIALHKY